MKSVLPHRLAWLLLVAALVIAACAPDPEGLIISPDLGNQMAAIEAGQAVVVAAATPAPKLADLAPEEITAGLPEDLLAAMANANAENGANVALVNGCVGCHAIDPAVQLTGPTWYNLGNTAVSRVPGESPANYLHISIVNPSAHIVDGYPNGIMPAIYGDTLALQDQADLIAYILAQVAE